LIDVILVLSSNKERFDKWINYAFL